MADTWKVVKVVSDASDEIAGFNLSRPEKVYAAYGKIDADDYAKGDTLQFTGIGAKELIYGKFVGGSSSLEVFNSTSTASPIAFNLGTGTTEDIDYVVWYVKGNGKDLLQLTVSSST